MFENSLTFHNSISAKTSPAFHSYSTSVRLLLSDSGRVCVFMCRKRWCPRYSYSPQHCCRPSWEYQSTSKITLAASYFIWMSVRHYFLFILFLFIFFLHLFFLLLFSSSLLVEMGTRQRWQTERCAATRFPFGWSKKCNAVSIMHIIYFIHYLNIKVVYFTTVFFFSGSL